MAKIKIIAEFLEYLKHNKKWWLPPIILTLIPLGALLVLTQGSAIAPLVYTLF